MNLPRAIIFDMDGVMVDSEPLHERAFVEVIRKIGYADRLRLRFADYVGRPDQDLWLDFVALHQPLQSATELQAMKSRKLIEFIRLEQPLYPDLPELIADLAAHYRLGLASGSERAVVKEVLALQGLGSFFAATATSSEVPAGKPRPDIFLRVASLLEIDSGDCWVIEDSKPGVAAARAAGMAVIAITNTHPAAELGAANHVVRTYKEIHRLLLPA